MTRIFYGYARFADDTVMVGGMPAELLVRAYQAGKNDLVAISEYGDGDDEANWVIDSNVDGEVMLTATTVAEARACLIQLILESLDESKMIARKIEEIEAVSPTVASWVRSLVAAGATWAQIQDEFKKLAELAGR